MNDRLRARWRGKEEGRKGGREEEEDKGERSSLLSPAATRLLVGVSGFELGL